VCNELNFGPNQNDSIEEVRKDGAKKLFKLISKEKKEGKAYLVIKPNFLS
jgi:hypothetical protein